MIASNAHAATNHQCDNEADCLVHEVAAMIDELPAASNITVNNAAEVIDQIHAIDRVKVNLSDEQYEELLTLMEHESNGSGGELDVPARYMDALSAIQSLGGNSLFIQKKFSTSNDESVDVSNATVKVKLANTETNESQVLTLSTLNYQPGSLSADSRFYSANSDGSGWTYSYIVPAGTYTIEEVSDSGATINGNEFVTTSTTYSVGGVETQGSLATVEFSAANQDETVSLLNLSGSVINFFDRDGNPINVKIELLEITEDSYSPIEEYEYLSNDWIEEGKWLVPKLESEKGYAIRILEVDGNGYQENTGSIEFKVNSNGLFIEELDEDGFPLFPYSNTHEINIASEASTELNVTVASIEVGCSINVPGLPAYLPYYVTNSSGTKVLPTADDNDYCYLAPGEYTLYSDVDENLASIVNFPKNDSGVKFTVNNDYTVSCDSEDVYIEDYGGLYEVKRYLTATNSATYKLVVKTDNGKAFYPGISYGLCWDYNGQYISTVDVPEGASEHTYTWSVAPSYSEEDEFGQQILRENTYTPQGTYTTNDGSIEDLVFAKDESDTSASQVWVATIPGSDEEATNPGVSDIAKFEGSLQLSKTELTYGDTEGVKASLVSDIASDKYNFSVVKGTWTLVDENGKVAVLSDDAAGQKEITWNPDTVGNYTIVFEGTIYSLYALDKGVAEATTEIKLTSDTFTVKAKELSLTAGSNFTYDGREKTATLAIESGIIEPDEVALNTSAASNMSATNAGTYVIQGATLSGAHANNYVLPSDQDMYTWSISPCDIQLELSLTPDQILTTETSTATVTVTNIAAENQLQGVLKLYVDDVHVGNIDLQSDNSKLAGSRVLSNLSVGEHAIKAEYVPAENDNYTEAKAEGVLTVANPPVKDNPSSGDSATGEKNANEKDADKNNLPDTSDKTFGIVTALGLIVIACAVVALRAKRYI